MTTSSKRGITSPVVQSAVLLSFTSPTRCRRRFSYTETLLWHTPLISLAEVIMVSLSLLPICFSRCTRHPACLVGSLSLSWWPRQQRRLRHPCRTTVNPAPHRFHAWTPSQLDCPGHGACNNTAQNISALVEQDTLTNYNYPDGVLSKI